MFIRDSAMMRRYYPKRYEITALTADPCFSGAETDYLSLIHI